MTRINADIAPADLIDQHLVAEYREIVRIPNMARRICDTGDIEMYLSNIPQQFKLGQGHVKYFVNKLKYLHRRFISIKNEMDARGIANNMDDSAFQNLPTVLYNDIIFDFSTASAVITDRIVERIETMKREPTLRGMRVDRIAYTADLVSKYK